MPKESEEATSGREHGHGEGSGPRGPHRDGIDEAAGGADSSPLETEPSGSKEEAAQAPGRRGHGPDPQLPETPTGQRSDVNAEDQAKASSQRGYG
jgi:hypothetical protein